MVVILVAEVTLRQKTCQSWLSTDDIWTEHGGSHTGSGSVAYRVAANNNRTSRTGTLTVMVGV